MEIPIKTTGESAILKAVELYPKVHQRREFKAFIKGAEYMMKMMNITWHSDLCTKIMNVELSEN